MNFTLPVIDVIEANWGEICGHYEEMARNILKRAVALKVPGIVLEFELLPAMTENPGWGAEITAILHRHLRAAHERAGLKGALRVTPTDIRDQGKPPLLRTGPGVGEARRVVRALSRLPVPTSCRSNRWAARRSTIRP